MKLLKGKKGFTLIELVVVIAILGILAGIAIPRFLDATATARGAKIVADLRTIDSAIVIYNAKTGTFPTASYKDELTKNTAASGTAQAQYQLLASWPEPAKGSCVFPAAPNTTVTVNVDAYTVGPATGTDAYSRAYIGTKTASDLAVGGSGYSGS